MSQVLKTLAICYVLSWVPSFFYGDLAWDISLYVRDMQVCILLALVYRQSKDLISRCVLSVSIIYCLFEAHTCLFPAFYDQIYIVISITFLSLFFYTKYKTYNYKSDPVDTKNICFLFWKPRGGIHLLSSLLGLPFGGMSILCNGQVYGFRWREKTYQRYSIEGHEEKFTIVDSGIRTNDIIENKLNSLIGSDARNRTRCIEILRPVLNIMGPKFYPSKLELIPSIYAKKVIP